MFMARYEKHVYAIFRMAVGFLFLWHGSQKFFGFPEAGGSPPTHIVAIAGTIEFVGGMFIIIGLFTRWTAFIASGEMAYAYWTVHAPNGVLPIINGGELAAFYCFTFLFIAAYGHGILSVDNMIIRNRGAAPLNV